MTLIRCGLGQLLDVGVDRLLDLSVDMGGIVNASVPKSPRGSVVQRLGAAVGLTQPPALARNSASARTALAAAGCGFGGAGSTFSQFEKGNPHTLERHLGSGSDQLKQPLFTATSLFRSPDQLDC